MADEYDGRVVIDTELDNSGFEKGSDKLIESMRGVERTVNGLGETAAKAFTADRAAKLKIEPEMPEPEDVQNDVEQIERRLPRIRPRMDSEDLDDDTASIKGKVRAFLTALTDMVATAMRTISGMPPAELEVTPKTPSPDELQDAVEQIDEELPEVETEIKPHMDSREYDKAADRLQAKTNRLMAEINRMANTTAQGFKSTSSVLAFNNRLDDTAEKIVLARQELEEFGEQQLPTDQYRETTAAIDKAEKALLKLYDKRDTLEELGTKESSKQWQRLQMDIEKAEAEVERYEMAADRMRETGEAFVDPQATEQYQQMAEDIERAEQALQANAALIRSERIDQAQLAVQAAQQALAEAGTNRERRQATKELAAARAELEAAARIGMPATAAPDPSVWQRFGETVRNALAGAKEHVRSFTERVVKMGAGVVNAGKKVVSGFKRITSAVKGFAAKSFKFGGATNALNSLTKKLTSVKGMLVSRIKRTFIGFLFEQIKESFNELAKFDKRFDDSVSNMRNRTSELGANVMAAFGGLIRQIEPYITKAIETFSAGVTKINALLASLRGEDTMQVAVRRTESYADSLNDSAKSAEKAKEAQEKLNATLTSYDEIHKLDAPKDATAASESGADAEKTVYENVPVESILGRMTDLGRRIAERVADGIKSGNWKDAGRAISDGLNLAVAKLDEKLLALRPKAESAARNIADLLNGMVLGFDGGALGKTIADGLNLALGTAGAFLKRFDFYAFGATIGDGITGAVQNFEWETAGETFGNVINGFIDTAKGIIEHTDWNGLGRGFGRGLNRLVETVDWKDAARTMSAGIIGLLDSVSSFLEETDWQDFGAKIYEFLTNVDWSGIAAALMRGAGAVLGALAGFLWGLIKGAMDKVKQWWYDNAYENGEFSMEGLLEGIKKALKSIGTWIKKNIFTPFINGFKKAFGIASPSKEMKPYGEFIGEGILEGIKNIFSSIGNWITNNIVEPFKNAFKSAFHVVGDKANALIDNGKAIAGGIKSGISNGWTSITTFLSGKAGDIKQACEGIADSATSAFSADKFRESGRNIINGVSNGLTDQSAWDQGIGGKIMERIGWIKQAFTGFDESGRRIISGVGEGIGDQSNWDNSIGGRLIERVGWIQDAFDSSNFLQAGRNIVAGLAGGLDEAFQRAQEGTLEGGVATLVAASRRYYSVAANVARPAIDEITAPRELNVRTTEALGEIREVSDAIDDLDNKSIEIKADKAAGALDTIADKLAAIAQIFDNISKAFPDFSALPVPAVATGAFAPARTRVTESDGRTGQEIKQLLQSFIGRIAALEEAVAERPIRIEVPVVLDRTEIGKANATYVRTNGEISNGNGGLGWTS